MKLSQSAIARVAQVNRNAVNNWRTRPTPMGAPPFPQPLNPGGRQLYFDASLIIDWLTATHRDKDLDLFTEAMLQCEEFAAHAANPLATAQALAHFMEHGELPTADAPSSLMDFITQGLDPLAALEHLTDIHAAQAPEALTATARDAILTALRTAVTERFDAGLAGPNQPVTLTPFGPGALPLIATLARELPPTIPIQIVDLEPSPLLETSHLASQLALLELETRGVSIDVAAAEIPPTAIVFGLHPSPAEPHEFFAALDSLITCLSGGGCGLVVGASAMLTDAVDSHTDTERARFLAPTPNYVMPLRYAARLPRAWAPARGQSQLAAWAFHMDSPNEQDFPVAIADLSDVDASELPRFTEDLAVAMLHPERMRPPNAHEFLRATLHDDPATLRRNILRPIQKLRNAHRHQSHAQALNDAAISVGVPAQFQDAPVHTPELPCLPWSVATGGSSTYPKCVQVILGTCLATEHIDPTGAATVPVIGAQEVLGRRALGERTIDRLTLSAHYPNVQLTQAGDVVYLKDAQPVAMVDYTGGKVVQSPARIARPLVYPLRGRQPLATVTTSALLKDAITQARSKDEQSWSVPTMDRATFLAYESIQERIQLEAIRLERQQRALAAFERSVSYSLASGRVAAIDPRERS